MDQCPSQGVSKQCQKQGAFFFILSLLQAKKRCSAVKKMDKISSLIFAPQKIRNIKKPKWPVFLRDLRSEAKDIRTLKIYIEGFEQWKYQRQARLKQIEDKMGLNPHCNLRALGKVFLSGARL